VAVAVVAMAAGSAANQHELWARGGGRGSEHVSTGQLAAHYADMAHDGAAKGSIFSRARQRER